MAKETAKLVTSTQDAGKIDLKDPVVDVPPQSKWEWIKNHVKIHRPFYVWFPLSLIGSVLFAKGYQMLTGRAPIDDVPMGAVWNIVLAVGVVVLVNNTKARLFDDIDTRDPKLPWWRVLIDSCETVFLLLLFYFMVFRS